MFKKFLFALLCGVLLAGLAQAQPTLQGNVIPNVGDFATNADADTNLVQVGNPGPNQTWNFSALTPLNPPTPIQYLAPAGTPYAADFPTATLVTKVGGADTALYSYSRKEANQYLLLGFRSDAYVVDYIDLDAQVKYPTNYNGTYSDTYSYTTDAGTGIIFLSWGTHSVKYDAYGTLTTPLGTFQNAIRIKITTTQTDSAAFFGNEIINHHDIVTYDWLVANQPGALVSVSYLHVISETRIPGIDTLISESGPTKTVNYIPTGSVGVFDRPDGLSGVNAVSVGPNPAVDQLTLRFTADQARTLQIQLVDASGRVVLRRALDSVTGENTLALPVVELAPGAYFLTLSDGQGLQSFAWQKF